MINKSISFEAPKRNQTAIYFVIVRIYPKVFRADNSDLFCLMCDGVVSANKLFGVKQHLETSKHKRNEERK